ncbi:uncharacterized protein B0I36DRAFT_119534 [Microdochium trichocladiopsis]|uniref:Uncharacterized protein n=1 Tax=Microdochium trichocladiopsis TaxID=1682393 RepID=A0A9P9BNE5_9PEZI|nr:uncharacterized protein B0I36DRAFT_119534 [Microdochium trichocladiopsis]KAH7031186.1 hypothetical protein B0I36DRAFT_119534 [Microdochium trichocladiopsis]
MSSKKALGDAGLDQSCNKPTTTQRHAGSHRPPDKPWSNDRYSLPTADEDSKCHPCESPGTSISSLWSRRNSDASTAKSSLSSTGPSDSTGENHRATQTTLGSKQMLSAMAENEALRASIVQLEQEKTRLRGILAEHQLQRQRSPQRCLCASGEGRTT